MNMETRNTGKQLNILYWVALVFSLVLPSINIQAATYYLKVNNGVWTTASTWVTDACGGMATAVSAPTASDDVVICNGLTVNISTGAPACNTLTLEGGTISYSGNRTLTVSGDLYVTGGVTSTVLVFGGGANPNRKFNITGITTIDAGSTLSMAGVSWTQTGVTYVDGILLFTVGNSGNKTFNEDIVISSTGTFNNAIGETPTINGDIINGGSWIGCTGGTCTYTMGSVPGTYTISGNAVAMSILSVSASTTVINNGTLVLDGSTTGILTGSGTFTNGDGGILYMTGGSATPINITTFNASTPNNTVLFDQAGNQGGSNTE